jgi:hypothetical protein
MADHLTLEEREIIAHMHCDGKMQTQIADRLGRDKEFRSSGDAIPLFVSTVGHGFLSGRFWAA